MAGDGEVEFHLPDMSVSEELLDRVQFSVSSRNAESKVCETVAHLFGSPMVVTPTAIDWKYISTGVIAMLRNKELIKKKHVWTLQLCVYNIEHGVLVWKGKIPLACNYTVVAENFHVLCLDQDSGILGVMFQDSDIASRFHSTISEWITEGTRDDKVKVTSQPPKVKFRKEMISYPCNFQHVQGTQAIDQCLEIERVKGQILASLANLKLKSSSFTDEGSASKPRGSRSKKKEPTKPVLPFNQLEVPSTMIETKNPVPKVVTNGDLALDPYATPPLVHSAQPPFTSGGIDNSQSSFNLGRLSPLNLEDEINQSFVLTSPPSGLSPFSPTMMSS